jgi:hypothetical protein
MSNPYDKTRWDHHLYQGCWQPTVQTREVRHPNGEIRKVLGFLETYDGNAIVAQVLQENVPLASPLELHQACRDEALRKLKTDPHLPLEYRKDWGPWVPGRHTPGSLVWVSMAPLLDSMTDNPPFSCRDNLKEWKLQVLESEWSGDFENFLTFSPEVDRG